jgi:hypothetical protein
MDNPRCISRQEKSRPLAFRDRTQPRWIAARITAQHRPEAARDPPLDETNHATPNEARFLVRSSGKAAGMTVGAVA